MGNAVGGDIVQVTYQHPTVGTGSIFPKAGESSTLMLGGFQSDDSEDGIDGSGQMIDKMTRKRSGFEIVAAWDNNERQELEKVVLLAQSPVPATWNVTCVSGAVYKGTGKPVGDLKGAMDAATFPLKVAGGGTFKKIA